MSKNKNKSNYKRESNTKTIVRMIAQVMLTTFLSVIIFQILWAIKVEREPNVSTKEETSPATIETTGNTETSMATEEPTEDTEPIDTTSPIEIPIPTESLPQVTQEPQVKPIISIDLSDNREGFIGRLVIPSVGINLACRESFDGDTAQKYVDAKDSAAIYWARDARIIADHNNQGFANLSKVNIGDLATMYYKDKSCVTYSVVNKFKGHNTGSELTNNDYECIFDDNIGGLTLYTCYAGWENIWIVYLQPI